MEQEIIRMGVVDDHPLFLDGLVSTLHSHELIDVVGTGENAEDAIEIAKDALPDVMLLDLSMPGGGVFATRQIAIACPVVRIGILTLSETEDDVTQTLVAGAQGYILKGVGGLELVSIVFDLCRGDRYIPPAIASKVLEDSVNGQSYLCAYEIEILQLMEQGMTYPEVAETLNFPEKTVKNFVSNSLQKLQVFTRAKQADQTRVYP